MSNYPKVEKLEKLWDLMSELAERPNIKSGNLAAALRLVKYNNSDLCKLKETHCIYCGVHQGCDCD